MTDKSWAFGGKGYIYIIHESHDGSEETVLHVGNPACAQDEHAINGHLEPRETETKVKDMVRRKLGYHSHQIKLHLEELEKVQNAIAYHQLEQFEITMAYTDFSGYIDEVY